MRIGVGVFAGEMFIGQALADNGLKHFRKPLAIGRFAIVEPKSLFVQIAEERGRLYADISSLDAAL